MTIDDCRPEVVAFAVEMERRLRANDHKPGWKDDSPLDLAGRVREEARELFFAADVWRQLSACPERIEDVVAEAADVANMAMMVADVVGGLGGGK